MRWSIAETKARLSEVVRLARKEPQFIENRGERVAVLITAAEFERLTSADRAPGPTPVQDFLRLAAALRSTADLELLAPSREPEPDRVPIFDAE